mmetsp:Transcript_39692/g.100842  ORF Transcript_39692/g.100842 Transcript_39692/m.100842 type:complete len:267 (-) Transcript_39692:120-920(-)
MPPPTPAPQATPPWRCPHRRRCRRCSLPAAPARHLAGGPPLRPQRCLRATPRADRWAASRPAAPGPSCAELQPRASAPTTPSAASSGPRRLVRRRHRPPGSHLPMPRPPRVPPRRRAPLQAPRDSHAYATSNSKGEPPPWPLWFGTESRAAASRSLALHRRRPASRIDPPHRSAAGRGPRRRPTSASRRGRGASSMRRCSPSRKRIAAEVPLADAFARKPVPALSCPSGGSARATRAEAHPVPRSSGAGGQSWRARGLWKATRSLR